MTAEALVDNSKIEAICRECGNTLPAPEMAEFFNEEQLILNFWSCTNCGFQFETEEKIGSEATSRIDEGDEEAGLFPETFFHHREFECTSVQAVGYEDAIAIHVGQSRPIEWPSPWLRVTTASVARSISLRS